MDDQNTAPATPAGPTGNPSGLAALLRTSLYTNVSYLWVSHAVVALFGFAFWTLAARLYTVEQIGLGSATISAIVLVSVLSHLGLGMGLVRFLPEAKGRGPSLVNLALSVSGLMALVASVIFLIGLPVWSSPLSYLRQQPEYVAAFVLFAVSATAAIVLDQAFVAVRGAKFLLYKNPVALLVRMALLGLFVTIGGTFSIVAASGLATLVGVIVGLALLRRVVPSYLPHFVIERGPPGFFPFAIGNYVTELSLMAPGLILPIMVVSVLGSDQAGYYYIGWLLGQLLLFVSYAVALSLVVEGSHTRASLPALSRNALALAFLLVGAGTIVMLLAGDKLLLVFGASYSSEASGLLRLIVLASLPAVLVHLYLAVQQVRKDIWALVSLAGLLALGTLGTSYLLLPRLGIEGAGIGILVGYSLGALLALTRIWREVGWRGTQTAAFAFFRGRNQNGNGSV